MSHDDDTPTTAQQSPANRLSLDYRAAAPPRRVREAVIDIHTHVYDVSTATAFFEAADLYGIDRIVSMTPLDQVEPLRGKWGHRLAFIAIPNWRAIERTNGFQRQWLADLEAFARLGARRMKFWMAPPMRGRFGLTLSDAFFRPLLDKGIELGFDFMIHVADPSTWFTPRGRYADAARFGTKTEQYPQLEFLLEAVAPRNVIAAHMGGSIEEPDRLHDLLRQYPNLFLDTSATKWIVRGVADQPAALRDLFIEHADRILFGSDLVLAENYDFDHYASRYWAQRTMWETAYRGESPIEDPDADDPPRLAGLDLPDNVLHKIYAANAARLGY